LVNWLVNTRAWALVSVWGPKVKVIIKAVPVGMDVASDVIAVFALYPSLYCWLYVGVLFMPELVICSIIQGRLMKVLHGMPYEDLPKRFRLWRLPPSCFLQWFTPPFQVLLGWLVWVVMFAPYMLLWGLHAVWSHFRTPVLGFTLNVPDCCYLWGFFVAAIEAPLSAGVITHHYLRGPSPGFPQLITDAAMVFTVGTSLLHIVFVWWDVLPHLLAGCFWHFVRDKVRGVVQPSVVPSAKLPVVLTPSSIEPPSSDQPPSGNEPPSGMERPSGNEPPSSIEPASGMERPSGNEPASGVEPRQAASAVATSTHMDV
jgi:hypothetical protein